MGSVYLPTSLLPKVLHNYKLSHFPLITLAVTIVHGLIQY